MAAEPAPAADPTASGPTAPEERWEIARQWRVAWRGLKWAAFGGLILTALLVVGQVYTFHQLFSGVHPWLGNAFVILLTAVFAWFVVVPLARAARLPAIARPPDVDLESASIDAAHLDARFAFDRLYLKSLRANPALAHEREAIDAARAALAVMAKEGGDLAARAQALARFEQERIEPLLAPVDRAVERYIHAEASAVGAATAISMNGSIDAFIVLWRNANMVARVARFYYGRPSLRTSLRVLRDVAGSVVLSRALDDVTDMAGEALSGVLGKLGGMVAGPLMDGSVNALVTLKVGYLAKRRCRGFEAWSPKRSANAVTEVFALLQAESANVAADLVKRCGTAAGAAVSAGGKVMSAPRSAWSKVQALVTGKPERGAPSGPGVLPETGDEVS